MKQSTTKIVLIYTLLAIAVLSAVRFFQYTSLMDFGTGYFLEGAEFGGVLIYILLALFCAIFIVLAVHAKSGRDTAFLVSADGMGDNATRVLGFAEIIAGGLIVVPLLEGSFDVQSMIGACAALALIVSGFTLVGRVVPPRFTGHLKLLCAVYMMLRGAFLFNKDLTVLYHSDNLITLVSYVLIAAFFASESRFFSRIETKNSRTREIITAGLALLASSVHVFPKLLAYAFGGAATAGMSDLNTDIAAGAVTSLSFIIIVFCTQKKKDIIPLADEDAGDGKKKKEKKAEHSAG